MVVDQRHNQLMNSMPNQKEVVYASDDDLLNNPIEINPNEEKKNTTPYKSKRHAAKKFSELLKGGKH